jgi:hypothetical protein
MLMQGERSILLLLWSFLGLSQMMMMIMTDIFRIW